MKYLLLLLVIGCASAGVPDANKDYKKNLKIIIDSREYVGTASVANKAKYKFHIKSRGEMEKVVLKTCNRNWYETPPRNVKKWFLNNKKEAIIEYIPNEIERGFCPVKVEVFEKNKGRNGYFLMIADVPDAALTSTWMCDGKTINYSSSSLCNSKNGLMQKIVFPSPTKCTYLKDSKCDLEEFKVVSNAYEFVPITGKCAYKCKEVSTGKIQRFITETFEETL